MIFDKVIGPARSLNWVYQFWPVLATSLAASLAATALCKKVALKFGITDKPDDTVKTHKEPVAYLGGLGILAGLTVGVFAGIFCLRYEPLLGLIMKWLLGVVAGAALACMVGLVDDLFDIRPKHKLIGCAISALILIIAGILPNLYHILEPLNITLPDIVMKALQSLIVIFFVLGATNSLNLLDGLDGLCAGVTAVIAIAMFLLAAHLATWGFSDVGDPVRVILCLGLVGAVFGFLPFNRHPAKIFMGDAGSMLLGFVVAALMILFAETIPRWWMASIVVFGLPILDTAVALVRRLLNGRPLFVSDRGHVYDQLIDRGIPLTKTVTICYILAGIYAAIGVFMSQIRTRYAAAVYMFVFIVSAFVVWKKGFLKMEGLRGAVRKTNS